MEQSTLKIFLRKYQIIWKKFNNENFLNQNQNTKKNNIKMIYKNNKLKK